MHQQKPTYTIVHGNIADYQGGAIVVPCWTNRDARIWPELTHSLDKTKRVPLFSAHFYPRSQLLGFESIILAACYADADETETSFYERASQTTANVLRVANENGVDSIAFPLYMAGHQKGKLTEIVPAMVDEFEKHMKSGVNPSDITLYLFAEKDYKEARQLIERRQ